MPTENRLLDALSAPLRNRMIRAGKPLELPIRTSLGISGHMPDFVYLLTRGAASIVVRSRSGGSAEVGMIGNEGLVNATALMGPTPSQADTFIQIPGAGLRIPLPMFRACFNDNAELRDYVLQHVQAQVVITGQLSACNRLHAAEERLARWLLTAADLTHQENVSLTQELLAEMLGSQRTTVALVAGALQRAGFIDYSRGTVRIMDRAGLEQAACACYRVTRSVLASLYVPYKAAV